MHDDDLIDTETFISIFNVHNYIVTYFYFLPENSVVYLTANCGGLEMEAIPHSSGALGDAKYLRY